ncbi:glyco protein hormone beta-5 [Trichinella spiralis]|uniref:glyco protein hormone beta-5 n=1 Tax=Trichinella spiralis TaxID=6334 RepID=UPI0001EFD0EC|nr:glyco protein hormone beta-5 [Trichinella spiralis]
MYLSAVEVLATGTAVEQQNRLINQRRTGLLIANVLNKHDNNLCRWPKHHLKAQMVGCWLDLEVKREVDKDRKHCTASLLGSFFNVSAVFKPTTTISRAFSVPMPVVHQLKQLFIRTSTTNETDFNHFH